MSTMLVGSHARTGDEREAAAAPLADSTGNIETATGRDTARRSRWLGGEAGLLSWLTALTFSLGKEAKAADPNVTFLDDGNITYKDLEHGAFELVTKEAVPRHIVVEDPGVTIVLRPQGSSVIVNQLQNSPARHGGVAGSAAGGALDRYQRGGVDRVEYTPVRQFAAGAADQLHPESTVSSRR